MHKPAILFFRKFYLNYLIVFAAAELCGEKLAWFFGITSPKYGYALEEYKRMEREVCL